MKKGFLLIVMLTMAITLVGCRTKETVTLGEVVEKGNTVELNSGTVLFDVEWENEDSESIDFDMEVMWTADPVNVYMKQTMQLENVSENTEHDDIEIYLVQEETKTLVYMTWGEEWYQMGSDAINEEDLVSMSDRLSFDLDGFTEEMLQTVCTKSNVSVNGRKTYEFVISGTLADLAPAMDHMINEVASVINVDMDDVEITLTLHIDKETYIPVLCTMETENESGKCTINVTYEDINQVHSIIVPEEVKEDAINFQDSIQDYIDDMAGSISW